MSCVFILQDARSLNVLAEYLRKLSELADSTINCGPVLNWLELDNRGHRLIVTEDNAINTPAVAAAYAIRRYVAQAADEISFEVAKYKLKCLTLLHSFNLRENL